jgi:predicted secreted protein
LRRPVDLEVRRLLVLAALALAAFILIYLLAVRTELGQRLDQAAFAGGDQAPPRAADAAGRLLRTVSVGGLVISAILLGAVAALRRRPSLIAVPAAVIGLTTVSVEILKHAVLARPTLLADPMFFDNTYPSGHTAIAISIGLSAVLVAPARLRPWVAAAAALLAAGFGVFVVTAGWHFPSDALGAYALALAVAAAVMAAVLRLSPRTLSRERDSQVHAIPGAVAASRLERAGVAAAIAFFVGVSLFASLRYGSDIDWTRVDAAYLGSMAAIVFAAALTPSSLLRALSGSIGPRQRPEAAHR